MNPMDDAKRTALDTGAAALLPAMLRKQGKKGAALKNALQAASAMKSMQVSNEVIPSTSIEINDEKMEALLPAPRNLSIRPVSSRAALHHILKR